MPKCAICGETLVVTSVDAFQCPHQNLHAMGEPKIGSAVIECPQKKGAIWVRVADDAAKGLRGIPVTIAPVSQEPKPTDPTGFSSFDPLDEGTDYTVEIDIPEKLADEYYPPKRTKVANVPVSTGQITSVEFVLERVAPLRVIVDHPENFPGKLDIAIVPSLGEFKPSSSAIEGKGCMIFPKLRKHTYSVDFKLSDEQKKLFQIEGAASQKWLHDPSGKNEVAFRVVPLKLLRLEVTEAHDLGENKYWCVANSTKKVRVKAITDPNDKAAWDQLTWSGGTVIGEKNEVEVDISAVRDIPVKATLDGPKSVTIEVYDLVKLDCPDLKNIGPQKWKTYESDKLAKLKATTQPDEERVWKHLAWSSGTPSRAKNECEVERKPVGNPKITVSLDSKPLEGELRICQWPVLEIKKVTFDCHEVENDGVAEIGKKFSREWHSTGKTAHVTNAVTNGCQSPVCYTKGKKIKLTAVFDVVKKATEDETVSVKALLGFGEVKADITVSAGSAEATMPQTESSAELPDKVDCQDAWKIDWQQTLEDGNWTGAKSSTHLLYVTLGDPAGVKIYFTLLDISCRAAIGKNTEDEFVLASFDPFKTHRDDNNGIERKGDGLRMSYYKQGVDTEANDNTYTTKGILSGPDATGRCGGWADLLLHMWKIHGVVSAGQRWFVRALTTNTADMKKRFLVKNCDFSAPADNPFDLYTHDGAASLKLDGVPGQGKKNPQFDFGDHVVVRHGGKLYDPSYGIGPYANDKDYLSAALDGLASMELGAVTFDMAGPTPLFISAQCVPYSKGFAQYKIRHGLADIADEFGVSAQDLLDDDPALKALRGTVAAVRPGDIVQLEVVETRTISATETLDVIAADYGSSAQELLDDDPALMALRGTVAAVQPGDTVQIEVILSRVVEDNEVTFDMIAMKYGKTKQEIFDHALNSTLKSTRLTPDNVVPGDVVIVSWELVGDGQWVIGHDL